MVHRVLKNVASHLGLYCMPMSHKKDVRLIHELFLHSDMAENIHKAQTAQEFNTKT